MAALVTLTSDFGTRDSYVAEMKGVLLSEGPSDLRLVDLGHELTPFRRSVSARGDRPLSARVDPRRRGRSWGRKCTAAHHRVCSWPGLGGS